MRGLTQVSWPSASSISLATQSHHFLHPRGESAVLIWMHIVPSSSRIFAVRASGNWRRKESTRRWRTFGRSSKVSLVFHVVGQWRWLIRYRLDGSLDGYQKKKYNIRYFRLRHPVLKGPMKQICSQDHLHVYPWLQGRRWTHGSRKPHFKP